MISPSIRKNETNGNLEIFIDNKYIPFNNQYKIILFTTSQSDEFCVELVSQVTTVNFSITFQQLQEKLVGLVVSIQYPE